MEDFLQQLVRMVKKGLGFWKALGFQNVAYPMLECILKVAKSE